MAYEKNRRRPPVEDDGTLIEGRNAVLETLRAGRAVDKVFVAEGAHIGDVAAEARKHRVPVVTCDRRKLDGMSPTGNHQGVIAQAAAQEYVSLDDIFRVAEERSEVPLIVACDGIEDPHNLGAIIRSAETAGAHGVIIPKRRAVGLTAAVARSAAGALAYVGVHKGSDKPLGRLANSELRNWKKAAHAAFDPLWKYGPYRGRRNEAYRWLSEKMGTPIEFTHIGMFDVDQCRKVVRIMQEERKQLWKI